MKMPPKRRGPLQTVQRNTDDIKREVDILTEDVKQLHMTEENEKLSSISKRCDQLLKSVEDTMQTLKKLTKADEPAPVGNYDQRKLDEEKRLQAIHRLLQSLSAKLSTTQKPDTRKTPGSSKAVEEEEGEYESEEGEEGEEEDDEEENEDNEEENDDEEEEEEDVGLAAGQVSEKSGDCFVVLSSFKGEQDGDLAIQKGDILHILSKNPDGWWLAKDLNGNQGLVPKTFLKVHQEEQVEEKDDEEDFDTGEESDKENNEESRTKQRTQVSNWDVGQKATSEMNATDVLAAMGVIPSGFRPSTLSKLLTEDNTYRSSYFIQPELSWSQLSFKDLFWNPDTGSVRPRTCRTSLTLTLWSCRMIPGPGVGVQVLSRHVRLCVFDGAKVLVLTHLKRAEVCAAVDGTVLSNIHTVRASHNPKNHKTWTFSPRTTGILPTLLDGDCFVRSDSQSPELGILFELGVTYIRNSTGEQGDLSCGWTFLKLFDASGASVPHRTYELTIHGGTPYEKDVAVDSSVSSQVTGSVFHQMMMSRKQAKLIIKLKSPNARTRATLNLLPDTLVGSTSSIHLLGLYRQVLADALFRDRPTMQNADVMCSPILATFPLILDQTDLLDALRSVWAEKLGTLKRSEKRDVELLKGLFVRAYLNRLLPLLHSTCLLAPQWANEERETLRWRAVFGSLPQAATWDDTGLTHLLAADPLQEAFDITQVTYDFLTSARRGMATS